MHELAAISLTHPLMLAGLGAVLLPIAAHLLYRRARRRVVFPTVALLREAAAGQSRLMRLRRPILLALRCLAVILIAAAFARPLWHDAAAAPAATGEARAAVLVLDRSASTAQRIEGRRIIDRIRTEALAALDDLRPGRDRAELIFAGAEPRPAYGRLVPNLAALRSDLRSMQPTEARADLSGAIARAVELLRQHDGPRRLLVFSDMQRTNWRGLSISDLVPGDLKHRIRSNLIRLPGGAANTALSRPRLANARPIAGRPARATVAVTQHGPTGRSVEVRAAIGDQIVERKRVELAPGRERRVAFPLRFEKPGRHRVTFSIPSGDALASDDRARLVADVMKQATVLVVGDDAPDQPTGSSYFLLRALAPGGERGRSLAPRHLRSDALNAKALNDAAAVILGDVGRLPQNAAALLERYIEQGGGVLMFCGPGPVAANAKTLDHQTDGERNLLPWRPIALRSETRRITDGAFASGILRPFDVRSRRALQQIVFQRTYSTGEPRPEARTLLRYGDGGPALSVHPFGRGRIMLANFSPSPGYSDLAKRGSFVALLHTLIDTLRSGGGQTRNRVLVGQTVARMIEAEALNLPNAGQRIRLDVAGPDDASPEAVADRSGGSWTLRLRGVSRAGFYEMSRDGQAVATIAANVDPRESDLQPVEPRERPDDAGSSGETSAAESASGTGEAAGTESGFPLWPWLLLAAAGAFALEMALLSVWSR